MQATPDPLSIRRLYGRARGHALRPRAAHLVAELLPKISIPEEGPLSAGALFGDQAGAEAGASRPLALEIGFGKGEHLAFQAARAPATGFLGAEPYLNGVAGLLAEIDDHGLANVRIHQGDAIDVLERLPDAALDTVWLLPPAPWPKARHEKRRFVNPGPLALVAAKLKPGGELRIATDHVGYLRHSLVQMQQHSDFEWLAESPDDWEQVPADWPDTRFAQKARALGHAVWRLIYRRV